MLQAQNRETKNSTWKTAVSSKITIYCMLRYKTETRPGLVALNDSRPGNGAGQFLQPRSPHGATFSGAIIERW